jgi:hypothetical protein
MSGRARRAERARRAVAAVVAVALAGVAPAAVAAAARAASPTGVGCHAQWPVWAFRAGAARTAPAPVAELPIACATATGYATSETTLGLTNGGAILFSPANTENSLARSIDGGRTWGLVQPQHMQYTSLWNTVDPQVVVDRRTGRVFWVHTTYTEDLRWPLPDQSPAAWLVPTAVANAHGFQVYSSTDSGQTWKTADYHDVNTADWEKLFVGPPRPASTGAPQPTGYPDVVYVCANAPLEVTGPGRACYRSLDGGVTFTSAGLQFPSAVAPLGCPALAANTGVVAPDGTVYIPQSCSGGTYLAVSGDEGASYRWLHVPGAPAANGLGAVVQLAIDQAGDLYLLWLAGDRLELTSSGDGGQHWNTPVVVTPPELHSITLPALAAGPRGHVGVVYYASAGSSTSALSGYISQTTGALGPRPLFYVGTVNDPADPMFDNYGDSYTPRADFVGAAYDAHGDFWGGLVEQLGPPNPANRIATTGYVARLGFRATRAR